MGRLTNPHEADCDQCAALCCVLTGFSAGDAFAFTKADGVACQNLAANRCTVHADLDTKGLRGCSAFTCFGAGQRATKAFGLLEHNWGPASIPRGLDDAFGALCAVQYCRWLVDEARRAAPASQAL